MLSATPPKRFNHYLLGNPYLTLFLLQLSHGYSVLIFLIDCERQQGKDCVLFRRIQVQFSHSFMSNSLLHHGLQHARLPCPSPTPRAYSNSCPPHQWCHPTISSSVIPFTSHLHSSLASGSFPMSQFFTSGGQSIGVSASASVLPMIIQDWFP